MWSGDVREEEFSWRCRTRGKKRGGGRGRGEALKVKWERREMGLALIAGWKMGLALPLLFFLVRMSGYLGKGWREGVVTVVVSGKWWGRGRSWRRGCHDPSECLLPVRVKWVGGGGGVGQKLVVCDERECE